MLNPHEYHRQNSFNRDIFKTDRSLPLLNNKASKQRKLPLQLPQINQKKNKYAFYDELVVSPEYVKISKTQDTTKLAHRLRSSRVDTLEEPSILSRSRRQHSVSLNFGTKILPLQKLAEEDRIVQKFHQNDQRYKKLVSNIKRRVKSNHEKQAKKGLELIYDRLMKIL